MLSGLDANVFERFVEVCPCVFEVEVGWKELLRMGDEGTTEVLEGLRRFLGALMTKELLAGWVWLDGMFGPPEAPIFEKENWFCTATGVD